MSALSLDETFAGCLIAGLAFAALAFPFVGRRPRFRLKIRLRFLHTLERRLQNMPGAVPVAICSLFVGFGLAGLAAHQLLGFSALSSIFLAVSAAIALCVLNLLALSRFFSGQAKEMESSPLVGTVCSVSLCIPAGGVGSVAYVAQGKRHCIPARSSTGNELPKGCRVLVTDLQKRVAIVEEL